METLWVSQTGASLDYLYIFCEGLVLLVFTQEAEAVFLPGLVQPLPCYL